MSDQALHVVELRAENVKRLKAVRIAPDGNVVIIGGENAQGKSSVLDCIQMAIAGAKAIPGAPIRRGESEANIVLDLGEIRIERTFDASGTKLIVRNAEGVQQKSPQALLDKLYSKVAFNPLEFATQKPAEQLATLKRIIGLDCTELDGKRAKLYEERTGIGRRATDAEARINTYPTACMNAPDVEVSVSALMAEKEAADAANAAAAKVRQAHAEAQKAKSKADEDVEEAERALKAAQDRQARAEEDAEFARVAAEALTADEDTAPIIEAIKGADDINRMVRAKQERANAVETFEATEAERKRLTKEIEAIDEEKASAMKAAKWPIAGLGFSADGVTFNRLPFEQASSAERLKTSLAIGMEQNPRLRVLLLPDASLLDKASMAIVREMADDNNMQIWIERVSDSDPGAIIIEDGEIKGDSSNE